MAGILHLGNIVFEEDDDGNAAIDGNSEDSLEDVGELLAASLLHAIACTHSVLTFRKPSWHLLRAY